MRQFFFIFCLLFAGTLMSRVPEPKYRVLKSQGDIELREYGPLIVAEVEVAGKRKEAINAGFRLLADYIFGNNAPETKIAMTAPVVQQGGPDLWKVRFVMPQEYTIDSLPKPRSDKVHLLALPGGKFAVIRYSGLAGEGSIEKRMQELQAFVKSEKLNPLGEPLLAFYDPPWTLPFMRRNEIMIQVN